MNKLYNEETKERFLSTYENEETRYTIRYTFYKSESTESMLNKDLYDFNEEEISSVIKNHNPYTLMSAKSIGVFISQYITWAIEENLRKSNIHPMGAIGNDFYKPLINRTTKIHYSYEELIDLIEELDNAQDQSMVMLWFIGVSGKNFSELKNLTYYDVDWNNNILTLKDHDGSIRKLELGNDEVALRCMRYLENAYKQQYYSTYNKSGIEELPLFSSDYIFRNVEFKLTKEKGITTGVIYSRLANIKDRYELPIFSQKAINQSGQIFMAYQIYMRDGHFGDKEQWYEIGERYNVSKLKSGNSVYPNTRLMKEYISTTNLKELYDVDIPIEIRKRTKK